jgi:hypothetical protein
MYHKVRGQDTIKLYVIYNALEVSTLLRLATPRKLTAFEQIADKLCSAFGQDILDTLFSKETLEAAWWSDPASPLDSKRKRRRKRERATPFFFFMLGLAYVREFTFMLSVLMGPLSPLLFRYPRPGILLPACIAQCRRQLVRQCIAYAPR